MNTEAIDNILRVLEEDILRLVFLKVQVMGITSARTDIINGGPNWWVENYRGVSNIFSAISITERNCYDKVDLFKGLLGIFSGLFSQEEIEQFGDDMDQISFSFFKRLSTKTGYGWTKLAISSRERGEWDWIPVVENNEGMKNTNCFAGVIMLGDLKKNGQTKVAATTSIKGTPRKYLKIVLRRGEGDFRFVFKGCNCGKKVKTGTFSSEQIPGHSAPRNVYMDETGRTLVQCATILGSLLDPNNDVVAYRTRLLGKLLPMWKISDPNAKPKGWIDRCVSGTPWEQPTLIRPHNLSMNYNLVDIDGCGSRLANETTQNILCQVTLNCGCDITAPFSFIFEAITAVEGSSLGATAVDLDRDNRIILQDGLGLVQAGEVGRAYNLIAFGGDVNAHKTHASSCRSTKAGKPLPVQLKWPIGRALVREEFSHDLSNMMRNYGYVDTNGSGNLLICRNHPLDPYRIIGVCIDKYIENEKGGGTVTIR
ncbi:hypothetical protein GQ53DRAFT_742018 [Thozetella sp. PMI_491]|nr:hypothetical protein GQ53DRAFT_742018 [Thozetella sp. PMI_491]